MSDRLPLQLGEVSFDRLLVDSDSELLKDDKALEEVLSFFSTLVSEYECNSDRLNDPRFQTQLIHDLEIYRGRVLPNILIIKYLVERCGLEAFFPAGWGERLVKMAYFIFFIHYGQKRTSETDPATSEPLDYVYHPFRATFSDCAEKIGLLDEETLAAEFAHDVFEDFQKGLLGKLLEIKEADHPSLVKRLFDFVDNIYAGGLNDGKNISTYIARLTKRKSVKKRGRVRPVFDMMAETCASVSDSDDAALVKAVLPLLLKMADVLDNQSTVMSGLNRLGRSEVQKISEIRREALFLHLPVMSSLRMLNSREWMVDFWQYSDPHKRDDAYRRYQVLNQEHEFIQQFWRDFADNMKSQLPDCLMGVHYFIEARPRNLNRRAVSFDRERQHPLRSLQAFNHYLIFVCTDASREDEICNAADRVFKGFFPRSVGGDYAFEKNSDFGRHFQFGRDAGPHPDSSNYGSGAWVVCKNYPEAEKLFYGDVHAAYHSGDVESIQRLRCFFQDLGQQVSKLNEDIVLIDKIHYFWQLRRVEDVIGFVRTRIQSAQGDFGDRTLQKFTQNRDLLPVLEKLMNQKILALFVKKVPVRVSINGSGEREVLVPEGADIGCVLLYADLFFACKTLISVTLGSTTLQLGRGTSLSSILKSKLPDSPEISFELSEGLGYSLEMISNIGRSMERRVLRPHKKRLLGQR